MTSGEVRTSDPIVEFYAGYGTLRELRWVGTLTMLPHVGQEVAIGEQVYDVDKVRHILPKSKRQQHRVEVTIR